LSRMWLHLGKQRGGIGTRGPGEQQLEVDRRRVRERINRLKKDLREITDKRDIRRARREKFSMLSIAFVGYTNSGKSTLFNALTSSSVVSRDQLFSTLDPTVRKVELPNNQTVLLSDTVGFLHDLPHHLIESFKATLEEVTGADILFHVIDMSSSMIDERKRSVMEVLKDLGVSDKPLVTVLNKSDRIQDVREKERIVQKFGDPLVVSALEGRGLSAVTDRLVHIIQKDMADIELDLPHRYLSIADVIRRKGNVKELTYTDSGLFISARVPVKVKQQILKRLKRKADKEL
ncbi:MAG: GTPase HflX, partial [Candidatus Omnitrophica bacterium]|nr:GTPase HflX [Candidatus Omnitrophota bacterium]